MVLFFISKKNVRKLKKIIKKIVRKGWFKKLCSVSNKLNYNIWVIMRSEEGLDKVFFGVVEEFYDSFVNWIFVFF